MYNGEQKECWTSELYFNVVDLCAKGDVEVDVYVYKDDYYIDNSSIEKYISNNDKKFVISQRVIPLSFILTMVPSFFLIAYLNSKYELSDQGLLKIVAPGLIAFIIIINVIIIIGRNKKSS